MKVEEAIGMVSSIHEYALNNQLYSQDDMIELYTHMGILNRASALKVFNRIVKYSNIMCKFSLGIHKEDIKEALNTESKWELSITMEEACCVVQLDPESGIKVEEILGWKHSNTYDTDLLSGEASSLKEILKYLKSKGYDTEGLIEAFDLKYNRADTIEFKTSITKLGAIIIEEINNAYITEVVAKICDNWTCKNFIDFNKVYIESYKICKEKGLKISTNNRWLLIRKQRILMHLVKSTWNTVEVICIQTKGIEKLLATMGKQNWHSNMWGFEVTNGIIRIRLYKHIIQEFVKYIQDSLSVSVETDIGDKATYSKKSFNIVQIRYSTDTCT